MPEAIWLIIELDQDIIGFDIFMKFGKDRMRTFRIRARTTFCDRQTGANQYVSHTTCGGRHNFSRQIDRHVHDS